MLDYSALAALAAVIREGSFERAARALHVTPSAISQRIRLLEERVGCALVVRDQPCRPTETGRRLCQHVDRVRLLEQELQGTLPTLAPEDAARVALPSRMTAANASNLPARSTPVNAHTMSPLGVAPAKAKATHWFCCAATRNHVTWLRWIWKRCWRSSSLRWNA